MLCSFLTHACKMYGDYGRVQDDSRSYPFSSFLSSDDDRSHSGTISYPQTIHKKKIVPLHMKQRKKNEKRTKPPAFNPKLFLLSTEDEKVHFHDSSNASLGSQEKDEERSDTDVASLNRNFIENHPHETVELAIEENALSGDYPVDRFYYIEHNKEKLDPLHLTGNIAPTRASTDPYDSFEDSFMPKTTMSSEMLTSANNSLEKLLDNHELLHASTIIQERSMELTEVSKDEHEQVQQMMSNGNMKTNKSTVLHDILNQRDKLNSRQKSGIKGTPIYVSKNVGTNTVHKNSINHKLTNINYLTSNTYGITPAKQNAKFNNLACSDFENNSKPVYQTPGIEKRVFEKFTPYNEDKKCVSGECTPVQGNFGRLNMDQFYTPSSRADKENMPSLSCKTVSRLEVHESQINLKLKLTDKQLEEKTPAKQTFLLADIRESYMHSGGAKPRDLREGADSLEDVENSGTAGQSTLLNTVVAKEIDGMRRNEAFESHQRQQSEIVCKIPENKLPCNQKNESSRVNIVVAKDVNEMKRYKPHEFHQRHQNEIQYKICEKKLASNQKTGISVAPNSILNFSNSPVPVYKDGEKAHIKDTFDIKLKKSHQEKQVLYPKKENYLTINRKNYEVQHILGKGGSSKVFQVRDIETSQQLAVKVVDLSQAEKSVAEGYLNEITLLRRLQGDETVIKMIDCEYVKENEILYVAMEKGETDLSNLIKDISKTKQVPVSIVMHYWMEMLRAVKNIHANEIIHSDLKPANFLLVQGRLKLIDFGIACVQTEDMTSVHRDNPTGTFNYLSPEAIRRTSNSNGVNPIIKITYKSDIWSLGCILYNLLYGKTPFQHITHVAFKMAAITDKNHRIEYHTTRKDCPSELKKALEQCLTYDPKMRPTAAELLDRPYFK